MVHDPARHRVSCGWVGFRGLQPWKWLFVFDGLPSVAMCVVVLLYFDALWLDREEKELSIRIANFERGAVAGSALINSFGNIAGYVSTKVAGRIRESAGEWMELVLAIFSLSLKTAFTFAVTFVGFGFS